MTTIVVGGKADVSLSLFIQDSTSSVGAGLTGLLYNASGLVCFYHRPGEAAAQLNLATQTTTGAHSDGGLVEIDATNLPGVYRLDLSDAVCAAGVQNITIMLKGAANMVPCVKDIQIGGVDVAALSNDTVAADNAELFFDGTGYNGANNVIPTVTSSGLSSAAVDAVLDEVVEGTLTMRQMLRLFTAALTGKAAGGGTTTITFRNVADDADRITLTVDANGNRSASSLVVA
jgi:hypothetical protein